MTAEEWSDVIRLIPEAEHGKLVIVLQNGTELCVDTIIRYESQFLVLRGRQGGTVEEARAFFVPYDQMLCLRLDRIVKVEEIQEFFGTPSEALMPVPLRELPIIPAANQSITNVPTDPAVASRLLLERIRQMRANSAPRYSN
jgi:hypothetical protein